MQYTIYFDRKPLLLSDSRTELIESLIQEPGTLYQDELNDVAIANMIKEIQTERATGAVFIHASVDTLLQSFKKAMVVIEAGGGLVHTHDEEILLIFRRGKWDLPKGKVDEGETIAAAALREVREETGLQKLQLQDPLTVTYHTYYQKSALILKESHWFMMKSEAAQELLPQAEEDIEQCVWMHLDELNRYIENTHPSIIDVLQAGLKTLKARNP